MTIHEMMQEPSELTIGEVQGQQRDFARRISRLSFLVQQSLIEDHPITPERVSDEWRDEFLTNVIVPFLDKILKHESTHRANLIEGFDDEVFRRGEAEVKEEIKDTDARVSSLMHTIHILREWRG